MRAILSVSDKTGIVGLAQRLAVRGCHLISTGGTAKALAEQGIHVKQVSDVTGFPEMMDGRVKTLHPAIHGGILARRHRPDDMIAIGVHGILPIDLVVVNLYPFKKAADNPNTPFEALAEEIDIGGPSLLRAAAKNFRDVLVVVDPADYPRLLEELDRDGGPSLEFRLELMQKAFRHTADYDTMIADTMDLVQEVSGEFQRAKNYLALDEREKKLRYGENPHQEGGFHSVAESTGRALTIHQGKELSHNNLLDLDSAARLVAVAPNGVLAVIVKHTNPCGGATGATLAEAYVKARATDPLSAFGGIVGLNRPIDAATAKELTSTFIECVIAPSVDDEAKPILARKQDLRVVTSDLALVRAFLEGVFSPEARVTCFGVLSQEPDSLEELNHSWPGWQGLRVVTRRQPTPEEWAALKFNWRFCAYGKSNVVLFGTTDRMIAGGFGQMSRVDSVKVAVMKAKPGSLVGSVAASDAFFPFRDGLDQVARAGATAVVQPGGSKRDDEVIAAADEHGIAMVFTGRRHFRH